MYLRDHTDSSNHVVLKEHLLSWMASAGCSERPDLLAAVADAVARVESSGDSHPCTISNRRLTLSLARALMASGFCSEADRALAHSARDSGRSLLAWSPLLAQADGRFWLQIADADVVRPSYWAGAAVGSAWILDLRRFWQGTVDGELWDFQVLSLLVRKIADCWEESSGQGALVLVAGAGLPAAKEILEHCRCLLARESRGRGWRYLPHVLWQGTFPNRRKRAAAR